MYLILLALACATSVMAVTIDDAATVNVRPSGFDVFLRTAVTSTPSVIVFADAAGATNLTGTVGVELYPLHTGDPAVTTSYFRREGLRAIEASMRHKGLVLVRVSGCSPNTLYHYRAEATSGTNTTTWPAGGGLQSVRTSKRNSFVSESREILADVHFSVFSEEETGSIGMLSHPQGAYPVAAVVGDGGAADQAYFNLSRFVSATTGENLAWTGSNTFDVTLYGPTASDDLTDEVGLVYSNETEVGRARRITLIRSYVLEIVSTQGQSDPGVGVYTNVWGTPFACAVTNATLLAGTTQYVCTGWAGVGSVTNGAGTGTAFNLTNNSSLTWEWATNYWLTTGVSGSGQATPSEGWYTKGSRVALTAAPDPHHHFVRWEGDTHLMTSGSVADANIAVTLSAPGALAAVFAVDEHTLEIVSHHGVPDPGVGTYTNNYGLLLTNRVTSPDRQGATQYVCTGWTLTGIAPASGTGTTATITFTNNAALTWNWKTQYRLDTVAGANGSVSPTNQWVDAATSVTVRATADAHYRFVAWSGDTDGCTPNGSEIIVTMGRPRQIAASFARDEYTLSITSTHGMASPVQGAHVADYGTPFTCTVTNSPFYDGVSATQFVCTGWVGTGSVTNGSGTNVSFTLYGNSSVTWTWETNYWLALAGGEGGGVAVTSDWQLAESHVNVTAVPSNYHHFVEWTGPGTNMISTGSVHDAGIAVGMTAPASLTAIFAENLASNGVPEYWLASHGFTNDSWDVEAMRDHDGDGMAAWEEWIAGTSPTDRNDKLAFSSSGAPRVGEGVVLRWQSVSNRTYNIWRAGSLFSGFSLLARDLPATPPVNTYVDGTRPVNASAYYKIGVADVLTSHQAVAMHTLEVESPYGTPIPSVGTHSNRYGSIVTNLVSDPVEEHGATQYVCTGWTIAGSEPDAGTGNGFVMSVTNAMTLTWNWKTQFWLTVGAATNGALSRSDEWLDVGPPVVITATPDEYYHVEAWDGDLDGCMIVGDDVTMATDRPRHIAARFAENRTTNGVPERWLASRGLTNDTWEVEAMRDHDGDGMLTWEEWISGTSPTDRNDRLVLTSTAVSLTNDAVTIQWMSVSDRVYGVSRSLSLMQGFSALATNLPATPPVNTYTDTNGPSGRSRFYRISVERE